MADQGYGLLRVLRRESSLSRSKTEPALAPPAFLIDGARREVRSLWSPGDWGGRMRGEDAVDYDPLTLATAYKAGLTAFVCINIRAGIAAEIPIRVIDSTAKPTEDSPARQFIAHAQRLIWRAVASHLIWGSFYFLKHENEHGYPTRLEWLNPLDVQPQIDYATGAPRYYYIQRSSTRLTVHPSRMIVSRAFNPLNDNDGTSALEVAMVRSNVEMNIGKFGAAFFANSARPDGMLAYEGGDLDDGAQKAARTYWDKLFKGVRNAFRTAIIGGNGGRWRWTPINSDPVDLAMTELSDQADVKICAVMLVNPALAGLGKVADALSAQSTFEQIRRNQTQTVGIPDVKRILEALQTQWLDMDFPQMGWKIEPDMGKMIGDMLGTKDRSDTARNNVEGRLWTISEARDYTGRPPLEGIIDRNPEWPLALWQANALRRNELRVAVGLPVDPNDGYYIDFQRPQSATPQPGETQPIPVSATALPAGRNDSVRSAAMLRELDQWSKRIKRDGIGARFNCDHITESISAWIRAELGKGTDSLVVFREARSAIRASRPPAFDEESIAATRAIFARAIEDTQRSYYGTLSDLMARAFQDSAGRKDFGNEGRDAIVTAFQTGFMDGLADGGAPIASLDQIDPEDDGILADEIVRERQYWTALSNELYNRVLPMRDMAKEYSDLAANSVTPSVKAHYEKFANERLSKFTSARNDMLNRVDLYVNKGLNRIYELGKIAARANQRLMWVIGDTEESCKSCLMANSQIHRARDWARAGLFPKGDKILCNGFNCQCRLVPTEEPVRGRISQIPRNI